MAEQEIVDQDCYLLVQEDRIRALCVTCHDERMPSGTFYQGSEKGYSPYEWRCCLCDFVIHQPPDDELEPSLRSAPDNPPPLTQHAERQPS